LYSKGFNRFAYFCFLLIFFNEKQTQVWISDLIGVIPSITGKIELVYEGEQEGPFQVAVNLLDKAIRTQFLTWFPNPEVLKKRKNTGKASQQQAKEEENPYKAITKWFDSGNHIDLLVDMKDSEKVHELYKVDGLYGLVKKTFPYANEKENALMMEFVLHGLAAYSLISKKVIEGKIEFKDLIGSMMNLGKMNFSEEDDLSEEDFR
jgi:magnesium chelatase subunit I